MNEQLQALNLSTKDILVTKISQKLAQATADFQNLKRDITRNLNQVEHSLNTIKTMEHHKQNKRWRQRFESLIMRF